jgi:hypothetical protein
VGLFKVWIAQPPRPRVAVIAMAAPATRSQLLADRCTGPTSQYRSATTAANTQDERKGTPKSATKYGSAACGIVVWKPSSGQSRENRRANV